MAKKSFIQKIKDFFTGGVSSSGGGSSSSGGSSGGSRKRSSGSYYGGGYSSSYRSYGRSSREDEKEKQRQKIKEQNEQTTAKLAAIAKVSQRTDALSSGKKALPPEPKALANNGVSRAIEKIGKKSQHQKNLETLARNRQEKHNAYHEATHHRYDVAEEGISKEERERRKQNIRTAPMGEMMFGRDDEAVDVAKTKMKYDKGRTSFERGAANTFSLGAVNLAEKRLAKGNRKEAEDIYQKNKNKGAEITGSLAGGLAIYGGTAKGFEGTATNLVGKAAATQVGKKLGAEKLAQVMAGEGAKAAFARSIVGDAIQDSTIGAVDTTMDILGRDDLETFGDYAKAWVGGQAANYAMGLAGNVVGQALPVAGKAVRKAWGNFADESRKLRVVPKGVSDAASVSRIADIDRELDTLYSRIARGGDMSEEELASAIKRTNDLKAERATLERGANAVETTTPDTNTAPPPLEEVTEAKAPSKAEERWNEKRNNILSFIGEEEPKVEPPKTGGEPTAKATPPNADTKVEPPKEEEPLSALDERNKELKDVEQKSDEARAELGIDEKEYTVKIKRTTKSGKTAYAKKTVTAKSEGEAIAKATAKTSNVKRAYVSDTKTKADAPPPKKEIHATQEVDDIHTMVNNKREPKSLKEDVNALVDSAKRKFANSLDTFEKWNSQFLKSDNARWKRGIGAIDKIRRHQGIAARSMSKRQLKANGKEYKGIIEVIGADGKKYQIENGKSLKDIYDGLDESDFDLYLLLKHAPTRLDEGKPIFTVIENGKDFTTKEACEQEAKALLEKHPEFAQRAEELYQYLRNELQNRVDEGLISQEIANKWMREKPFYVPTGRVGKNGAGDVDIWDALNDFSNGNVTGAGGIKTASGDSSPVRSIKEQIAEATTRNWRDMSMNNLFKTMFDEKVAAALAKEADGGIEKALDNTINLGTDKGGKYYADVFIDGEPKRIEIDKGFYDDIEDLYKNGRLGNAFDVLTDATQKIAHPFKELITTWSPFFLVKNFMRDFPEAIINTRQTKEFMANMIPAAKDLAEGGEFSTAMRNAGVSQSNYVNLDEALIKNADNFVKKGLNKFATANEATEMYPRLVEFMATIKKAGYEHLDDIPDEEYKELIDLAAANAADVTVNFGRSGSVGKMLNRGIVPFFNPSIQGWSKFIRNFTEQESNKALIGLVLKATALGAAPTVINNYLLKDNPNYQMISARDKATNYIIPIVKSTDDNALNEADMFIKIPRSRFASVYGLPFVNVANENKMGWAEMLKVTNDQIAPVNPVENTIFSPIGAVARNKTWYGTPIVSEGIENKTNPSQEYDANTSYIGRGLGKATEKLPTGLQISPKKADYLIDAYTGIGGDVVLPMLTPSRRGGGGIIKGTGYALGNVAKRQFTIDPTTQNDLSTRFYNEMQKASDNSKIGSKEDKEEYTRLNSYSDDVSKLNQAIKHLQGGNTKTKQEDIYGLQKVRNQLMQDALDGKGTPSASNTLDAVQKYVGTSYAIENFGSSADQKAMRIYGEAKYGDISDTEMQKKIDADKDFYKGVQSIGKLQDKFAEAGVKSNTMLSKAVALASADANDDVFEAYGCKNKGRTESANKMNRARTYFRSGGSDDEFVKLEKARKTLGKLPTADEDAEIEKAHDQLAKGEITAAELIEKEKAIKYNANISYIGLATSLAQANAPERGYRLYDIKDRNIQKGINLAAIGYTARDYREMVKALDLDGNGYPSKKEVVNYVANSNIEDKATLFDALYSYQGSNPFGSPTNYTRAQAAETGRRNGIESISDESGEFDLNEEQKSSSGWGGYGGRYHYYGHGGGGSSGKAKVPTPKKMGKLAKGEALVSKKKSSSSRSNSKPALARVEAKIDLPTAKYSKQKRG